MLFLFWKSECKGNDWNVVVTAAPVALIVSPATSSFESSEKIGPHGNYVLIYADVEFSNLNVDIGKSCGHPVMVQMVQFTAVQVLHFWRHRRWKLLILRIKRCIIWVAPVNKTFSPTQPYGALRRPDKFVWFLLECGTWEEDIDTIIGGVTHQSAGSCIHSQAQLVGLQDRQQLEKFPCHDMFCLISFPSFQI